MRGYRITDAELRAMLLDEIDNGLKLPNNFNEIIGSVMTKGDYLMGEIFTVDELRQIVATSREPDVTYKVPCARCLFESICDNPNEFDKEAIDNLGCGGTIKYCLEKYCGGVSIE